MRNAIFWSLLVVLFLVAFITGSPILYRLIYALMAVALLGYLAAALAARRLEGSVKLLTHQLRVGDPVEELMALRNRDWWPKLLLEVEHQSEPSEPGGEVISLLPRQSTEWVSRKTCRRRGIYQYGRLVISSRDPLSLFLHRTSTGQRQTALAYPATVELPDFHILAGQAWVEGMVSGRSFRPSATASGVREYVQGDSFSHIHWRSTFRLGRLMTKEFEREFSGPSQEIWIVLDLWDAVQAGQGLESTVEYGVTIAASIARKYLDLGREVGLVASGHPQVELKAQAGPEQIGRVMEALALVEAGPGGSLAATVGLAAEQVFPKASVVVITPDNSDEVVAVASMVDNRGATFIPVLLDAASFQDGREPPETVQGLTSGGLDAYVVRRGDELPHALDSRRHHAVLEPAELALRRAR